MGWSIFLITFGFLSLIGGVWGLGTEIDSRIDKLSSLIPKDQKIATVCKVKDLIKEVAKVEFPVGGYFFEKDEKIEARILEERGKEVKVEYITMPYLDYGSTLERNNTKWIPKKDFHRYYSLKEVAEILNKRRK